MVGNQGYPNCYGAKIPVISCWDLNWLDNNLWGYHDRELLNFLRYGWLANRLPGLPPPTINHRNHVSALHFPDDIDEYLKVELMHGVVMGLFAEIPFYHKRVGVSPLSTRPKSDSTQRCVILDLSYPEGSSVNDWTPKDMYLGMTVNLPYPTVDDLAMRMSELGHDRYMYKCDTSRCFRWLPLDPFDYSLLGYIWKNMYYFDKVLAMGHRIAPYICQRVTSALVHIHRENSWFILNYVDDFVGAEREHWAHLAYVELGQVLANAGLLENEKKAVSLTQVIKFLGVTFNARDGTMQVSEDRLHELHDLLSG